MISTRHPAPLQHAFLTLAAPINRALTSVGRSPLAVDLLNERVALMRLGPPGAVSANGSCRLIRAQDDWIALNLARPEDAKLLPAWLEMEAPGAPDADQLADLIRRCTAAHWVERGALLGLAVAALGEARDAETLRATRLAPPRAPRAAPRVVDLSALWAGPLCGHLLHRLGAEVVKVESRTRPDGGRIGSPAFFARLNDGKRQLSVDFADPADIARLRALILDADVVIEASRPRALRQFGLDAETLMPSAPGLVWLSITAHGREDEAQHRIGYGDDAAVAGGLVVRNAAGEPRFIADAVADPLTGVVAAGAVVEDLAQGGGRLLSVSLAGVAATARRAIDGAAAFSSAAA